MDGPVIDRSMDRHGSLLCAEPRGSSAPCHLRTIEHGFVAKWPAEGLIPIGGGRAVGQGPGKRTRCMLGAIWRRQVRDGIVRGQG